MDHALRLLGLFCLLPFTFLSGCGDKEPVKHEIIRPVKAFKVGGAGGISGRSFPGRARAHEEVDLSFRVAGPLIVLPNDLVGREFRKDALIARIDPRDYEVEARDVEGQLERAQANAERAQTIYQRELNILKEDPGATSQTSVDQKRAQRDQANAEVKSLEASLDAAKDNLSYTYLKAPFDGTIVAKYANNFDNVRSKEPIVRLLDTKRIEMVVDIPETLISDLQFIKEIRVIFDAFPERKIAAEIYEVGTEASQTTRTYPVTLIMDQPGDIQILAGMAGRAFGRRELPKDALAHGIEVPVGAVFTPDTEKQNYVWVIDEAMQTATRRAVTTGQLTNLGIVVKEGIAIGEWIATAGVHSLREGQKVRILKNGED